MGLEVIFLIMSHYTDPFSLLFNFHNKRLNSAFVVVIKLGQTFVYFVMDKTFSCNIGKLVTKPVNLLSPQ